MTERLPLFPLGTVLYPGLLLPLHVFEERYRRLVRDLLAAPEGRRRFGVVAIREGREVGSDGVRALYDVGCVAELREVEPYDDGRFDIITTGEQRFRLAAAPDDSHGYLQAEVELLDDPAGEDADRLAVEVTELFRAYRVAVTGREEPDDLPDHPGPLSYLVAAATVLDRADKQHLLECPDTAGRLRAEARMLRRETAVLRRLPSVPAVELTGEGVSPN